jgi:tripartite-type tricarboxylate transporter receptor subunit TctC
MSNVWMASLMLAVGCAAGDAAAQSYPSKIVRLVSPEVGGGGDLLARLVAQGLTTAFGQQVIVDNRGLLGAEIVAKAPPDGYTVLVYSNVIWLLPFLRDNVAWDPIRDFAPVTAAAEIPNLLTVHPSLPVATVKELVALAKRRPGQLNYSSASAGSAVHLSAELFNRMAGVDIVRIPYKGSGPAVSALLAGQVEMTFAIASSVIPHVRAARLRAIALTGSRPSSIVAGVPTIAEAGLPGYEAIQTIGFLAPARTPPDIVARLQQETARVLARPEVRDRLLNVGAEPVGSTPAEFTGLIKADMAKWGKLIREAGIRDQ